MWEEKRTESRQNRNWENEGKGKVNERDVVMHAY